VGTAPLPLTLKGEFEAAYGTPLQESYGLSETLFVSTNAPGLDYRAGSVGPALPGVALKIVGDDGAEAPRGMAGEIWVCSPFQMAGYLDFSAGQPAPPASEWFASGDIGKLDGDGWLFITDRKKDIIIRGGSNVSPRAVEDVLLAHADVEQAAVVGVPHEFYGEDVVAFVKLKNGRQESDVAPALDALCRGHMGAASVPSRIIALAEFPTGVTGKILKTRLRDLLTRPA
jgi:long-chain acyl-CoA synthetase